MLCVKSVLAPCLLKGVAERESMERILIGIDALHPTWEALLRALCLGPRIQAKVCVLAVLPPRQVKGPGLLETPEGKSILRRIESEIEAAKSAGANVELFVAEGRYDQEIINAARQLKTTLLVASAPGGDEQGGEREAEGLGRILNGVDCRVELVSPKKLFQPKKDGT